MSEKTNQKLQSLPLSPLWSVRQEAFQTALSLLAERDIATLSAYYEREEDRAEPKPYEVVNGVAIVPLTGVLTRDRGWYSWLFGGTSIMQQRLCLMQATEDAEVESILLYAYSPGGEVYGIADFSGSVIEARKKKKVWAYAADECCSACYWAICRAEKILCNPTGLVGSIGIMQVVEDWSAAYKKQGVKVQVFKSGEYKGAGVPGTSLTEEQQAEYQRIVDAMAESFFADVEAGRKLSESQMEAISTGQCWIGAEAQEMGLIDEIGTLEGALSRLAPKSSMNARRFGAQVTQPPAVSGKKETVMRDKLAAALARLGLNKLAAAVLGAQEDDAEGLAQRLSAEVHTEVQAQIAAHPLLAALTAAEIKTPEALSAILADATDGRAASEEANKALEAAATRRFGQGDWKQYAAAYRHLPLAERKSVAAQWEADADKMFGTAPNQRPERQTVPTGLPNVALDANGQNEPVLSEAERNSIRAAVGGTAIKNGGGK